MTTLLYTTPYPDVNAILERYVAEISQEFGLDLTAVYLLGSLTTDDYVPGWSDIDGLIVLARPLADAAEREAAARSRAVPHPLASPPAGGEGERGGTPTLSFPIHTLSALRQPDWRTNPLGMVSLLMLVEYGQVLWGTDIRHMLIVPRFPSLRAYLIQEMANIIRDRPRDLPVRAPKGVGGPAFKDKSIELVNWLFYPARLLMMLETTRTGSKTMAVRHYSVHHFDSWEVWLRWAEAYRRLPERKPLTPKERKQLALAVQDFFWEVVNFILLGLGYDPETLTTDQAVLQALDNFLRTA